MNTATENPTERCPVMGAFRNSSTDEHAEPNSNDASAIAGKISSASAETSSHSPPSHLAPPHLAPPATEGRLKRFVLAALGVVFVFLAAVGVFLPGLPATGPLILASICLTKSCPWLEQRLVRSRFFAPFHRYLDGNAKMPMKARIIAIGMMWTCIIVSSALLIRSQQVETWFVALIVLSGVLGTWFIMRFRNYD